MKTIVFFFFCRSSPIAPVTDVLNSFPPSFCFLSHFPTALPFYFPPGLLLPTFEWELNYLWTIKLTKALRYSFIDIFRSPPLPALPCETFHLSPRAASFQVLTLVIFAVNFSDYGRVYRAHLRRFYSFQTGIST